MSRSNSNGQLKTKRLLNQKMDVIARGIEALIPIANLVDIEAQLGRRLQLPSAAPKKRPQFLTTSQAQLGIIDRDADTRTAAGGYWG
jgi:hypothetical protein